MGMSVGRLQENTLRPPEHLLLWAFALSLATHLLIYSGFQIGHHMGWWKRDLMPDWLKSTKQTLTEIKNAQPLPRAQQEPPLVFVDVDPTVVTPDAPKNAKYYSAHNSRAANPDATLDTETPKMDGTQTFVPKTETTPRIKAMPLQPSPPKSQSSEQETADAKPKPKGGQQVGDLALAKTSPKVGDGQAETDTGDAENPVHKRPRTLAEAKARQTLVGEKMKQDGGVVNRSVQSSLNAIGTPFGEYDFQIIEAIQTHWWDMLERHEFSRDRTGRVVIQFRLNYDGRVTDVNMVENTVGDILGYVCHSAITDPAPYAPFPADMRRMLGDSRLVQFTFNYY